MTEIISLLALGFLAGILAGLFGIGGGVIIVPALTLVFKYPLKLACGTSLGALLFPFGIIGFFIFRKKNLIDIKTACFTACGLLTGSFFGAFFTVKLASKTFDIIYILFLFFLALRFTGFLSVKEHKILQPKAFSIFLMGTLAGISAGFFGIGGGALIIPALIILFGFSPKKAMATSLCALLPPVGLPGVIYYNSHNLLFWPGALMISLSMFIGTFFGAKITAKLSDNKAKKYYGIFLGLTALYFTFNLK